MLARTVGPFRSVILTAGPGFPEKFHLMAWTDPWDQFSPPLGEVSVIAEMIVESVSLVSLQWGLVVLLTRML